MHTQISHLEENEKCWITFARFWTGSIQDLFVIRSDSIPAKNAGISTSIVVLTFGISKETGSSVQVLHKKLCGQTMLEYFSFLSFVKSGESHSNELSSKHCTFLRDAELLKALGNCQLNVHDELFPSPPTAFLHPIFWHQFHIVHGSKMCHCPLPLWRIRTQLKCVQNA